jgi:hypothetical protein
VQRLFCACDVVLQVDRQRGTGRRGDGLAVLVHVVVRQVGAGVGRCPVPQPFDPLDCPHRSEEGRLGRLTHEGQLLAHVVVVGALGIATTARECRSTSSAHPSRPNSRRPGRCRCCQPGTALPCRPRSWASPGSPHRSSCATSRTGTCRCSCACTAAAGRRSGKLRGIRPRCRRSPAIRAHVDDDVAGLLFLQPLLGNHDGLALVVAVLDARVAPKLTFSALSPIAALELAVSSRR